MPYVPRLRLLVPLAVLLLTAAAPRAAAGGGWSVAPSASEPEGRPYVYAEGAPGAVLQDSVSLVNPGKRAVTVRLRGADATTDGDDGARDRAVAGTGAWIAFAGTERGRRTAVPTTSVRVPARTRADVPFSVRVPAGAAPGDRTGVIVASGGGRSAAVRVRVGVTGPALSALTVEHVAVRADGIHYELVNRGTTVLAPRLAVRADGVFGTVLDRAPRGLSVELPPGRRIALDEPWTGRPVLDAVDVRLTVTAAGGARSTATASARFVPWGPVTAGALAAAVTLAALAAVRRRRRRTTDGTASVPEPMGAVT
ncbi:hypothetical protein ACFV6E_29670 [Streptomyces sp. NPDC059785]|uniref:hypothetical protein n=1 Tax=Streptomyces sp. NPDC059785 TaxID=3346945 RepID=UPI003648AC79